METVGIFFLGLVVGAVLVVVGAMMATFNHFMTQGDSASTCNESCDTEWVGVNNEEVDAPEGCPSQFENGDFHEGEERATPVVVYANSVEPPTPDYTAPAITLSADVAPQCSNRGGDRC